MDDRSIVDSWLRSLGRILGWPLSLNVQGVCTIGHASGLECAVEVPDEGGCVVLRAPLMAWYPERHQALAAHCLKQQYLGLRTQGASFGIDEEDAELSLWQVMPVAGLDEAGFQGLVARFLDQAAYWQDELEVFCQGTPGEQVRDHSPHAAGPSLPAADGVMAGMN